MTFAPYQVLTDTALNAAFDALASSVADVTAALAAESTTRSNADIAEVVARTNAISGSIAAAVAALTPLNVRNLGAVGNGIADDTAAIQAVINTAENAGGGAVFLPVGTYKITATLTIKRSGVTLIGAGLDCSHDFTPSWPTSANTAPVSSLLWAGVAGGTMISIAPVADADNGSGIGGNGVLDVVLQAGTYPFSSTAAYGVVVAAAKAGEYRLFGLEFSGAALFFSTLNRNPSWNNSAWFNTVHYLGSRNVSTAGGALKMDGVTGAGNAYNNTFHVIDALHTNGNAVDLYSCDNNIFHMTRIQRASGAGVGVFLHSAVPADMSARDNIFFLLSPGAGGVYSEATYATPAYENKILYYNPDENSAPATPLIGSGSTLFWSSTKRSGACNFHASITGSLTIPSGVITKVGFSVSLIDEATWYDTANARWKPRYAGTFFFTAAISIAIAAAVGSVQISLLQNGGGSAALRCVRTTRATGSDSLSVSGTIGLNGTTDYVEAYIFQDSGFDATISGSSDVNYFQGSRVA